MKLPIKLARLADRGTRILPRLIDANGVFIADVDAGAADVERIILSVNAMAALSLVQIRLLGLVSTRPEEKTG